MPDYLKIVLILIGILPIMGGAMLSATLVLEASDRLKLSPEKRTFNNYWFRHVWEYTLPTYPGIILIAANPAGRGRIRNRVAIYGVYLLEGLSLLRRFLSEKRPEEGKGRKTGYLLPLHSPLSPAGTEEKGRR